MALAQGREHIFCANVILFALSNLQVTGAFSQKLPAPSLNMPSQKYSSLNYLEENKLHPTRTARFAAARRLRLKNSYNITGQVIASVAMIIWSVVPLALKVTPPRGFEFFNIAASIALLALALYQQAGGYIDTARSLEASARAIDRLRGQVVADIGAGKESDPETYRLRAKKYADILEEHPVNHAWTDLEVAGHRGFWSETRRILSLHFWAGAGCWFSLCAVLVPPLTMWLI